MEKNCYYCGKKIISKQKNKYVLCKECRRKENINSVTKKKQLDSLRNGNLIEKIKKYAKEKYNDKNITYQTNYKIYFEKNKFVIVRENNQIEHYKKINKINVKKNTYSCWSLYNLHSINNF